MENSQAQIIRFELLGQNWEDNNEILYHQSLLYLPKVIRTELIYHRHDNLLASHFEIKKTGKLIAQYYYWPLLRYNVNIYVTWYNIYLVSKAIRHRPYEDLQLLTISLY